MIVTDAQVHIWDPETPDRPWMEGGRSFAHADRFGVDEVISGMESASVDRVVLVPPAFEGDRNDVCLAAAAEYPERFAVMGRIDLADPASRELVPGWRDQPGMLGMRMSFARGPAAHWLQDGTAEWFWPMAEEAGIPVMVFVPGQLAEVADIARRHPALRITVDHLGLRPGIMDDDIDPVLDQLIPLAAYENVAVKATCLPSHVSDPYPFVSLHGRIRRVVDAFGPRRTFWGSDLTRLSSTYDEVRRLFTEELDFLSGDDLEWVMGRGVSEWLRWPVAAPVV